MKVLTEVLESRFNDIFKFKGFMTIDGILSMCRALKNRPVGKKIDLYQHVGE